MSRDLDSRDSRVTLLRLRRLKRLSCQEIVEGLLCHDRDSCVYDRDPFVYASTRMVRVPRMNGGKETQETLEGLLCLEPLETPAARHASWNPAGVQPVH